MIMGVDDEAVDVHAFSDCEEESEFDRELRLEQLEEKPPPAKPSRKFSLREADDDDNADDITAQAIKELEKDATRAQLRASTMGVSGFRSRLAVANRKYLNNTIIGTIQTNRRIDEKLSSSRRSLDCRDEDEKGDEDKQTGRVCSEKSRSCLRNTILGNLAANKIIDRKYSKCGGEEDTSSEKRRSPKEMKKKKTGVTCKDIDTELCSSLKKARNHKGESPRRCGSEERSGDELKSRKSNREGCTNSSDSDHEAKKNRKKNDVRILEGKSQSETDDSECDSKKRNKSKRKRSKRKHSKRSKQEDEKRKKRKKAKKSKHLDNDSGENSGSSDKNEISPKKPVAKNIIEDGNDFASLMSSISSEMLTKNKGNKEKSAREDEDELFMVCKKSKTIGAAANKEKKYKRNLHSKSKKSPGKVGTKRTSNETDSDEWIEG